MVSSQEDKTRSSSSSSQGASREAETREHLANERTLLAWVRAGITLISVGFIIERTGIITGSVWASTAFGIALAVLGLLALLMGTMQYYRTKRRIMANDFAPTAAPYLVIVAGSVLFGLAFISYVLLQGL
jgi:putative membrane protein